MPSVDPGKTAESGTWGFISTLCFTPHPQSTHTHHEMLEEPRTHYIGSMLGQDSSFVLGLLILIVQEGGEVKVNLQGTWRKKSASAAWRASS